MAKKMIISTIKMRISIAYN